MTDQERPDQPLESLLDVALGAAAPVVEGVVAGARRLYGLGVPVVRGLLDPPLPAGVPRPIQLLRPVAERGRRTRHTLHETGEHVASVAVPTVFSALLDRLDLTKVVEERVDIDEIAATIDVNAVADRVDLLGLAQFVVDGIDLPGIIRESTRGVTSEAVRGVRVQGYEADQAVARVVDRMLLRRKDRQVLGANGAAGLDGEHAEET